MSDSITWDDLPRGYWLASESTLYIKTRGEDIRTTSCSTGGELSFQGSGMEGANRFSWSGGPHGYMPEDFWL